MTETKRVEATRRHFDEGKVSCPTCGAHLWPDEHTQYIEFRSIDPDDASDVEEFAPYANQICAKCGQILLIDFIDEAR